MRRWNIVLLMCLAVAVTGCAGALEDVGTAPTLTPVGSGITAASDSPSLDKVDGLVKPPSNWVGGNVDFFRDARAYRSGDLITVKIEINDEATLNSTSNRTRQSSAGGDLGVTYDVMGVTGADFNGNGSVNSKTSSAGQGTTARSERIQMSVAAMVTKVMPNGYLLIEGSQEVVVNFEQRSLHVAGLIRPADISPDNSISYEKIAEARIAYGGKGRITEVQQPGWAHQIWDSVSPF